MKEARLRAEVEQLKNKNRHLQRTLDGTRQTNLKLKADALGRVTELQQENMLLQDSVLFREKHLNESMGITREYVPLVDKMIACIEESLVIIKGFGEGDEICNMPWSEANEFVKKWEIKNGVQAGGPNKGTRMEADQSH